MNLKKQIISYKSSLLETFHAKGLFKISSKIHFNTFVLEYLSKYNIQRPPILLKRNPSKGFLTLRAFLCSRISKNSFPFVRNIKKLVKHTF